MVRGILNRQNSASIVQFFVSFLNVNNGQLAGVNFLTIPDDDFEALVTNYNVRGIGDFGAISKSIVSWKAILRKISTSLSKSHGLVQDLNAWFAVAGPEGEDEGQVAEVRGPLRDMLVSFDPEENDEDKSIIPGLKELCRILMRVEDYITVKSNMAMVLDARYNEFFRAKNRVEDISDLLKFGEITREQGRIRCTEVLNTLDLVVEQARGLFQTSPDEEIEDVVRIVLGEPVNADQFDGLLAALSETRYRDAARYEDARVRGRSDIQSLEDDFKLVRGNVARFNDEKAEAERKEERDRRSVGNMREDVEAILARVYAGSTCLGEMSLPELQFLRERVMDCEKRLTSLRNETESARFQVALTIEGETVRDQATTMLLRAAQDLIVHISEWHERTKEGDLRKKIELQSIERDAPTLSLPPLEVAGDFMIWESSYTPLKKSYRESGLTDWKLRLRDKIKLSLKRPEDVKACKGLLTLKEVESYLRSTFVKSHNLIHDLLEPIQNLKLPKNIKDSAENIHQVLKLMNLVQRRNLLEKVNEAHVDQIIKVCLLKTDYRDYVKEWAEHLRKRPRSAHSTRIAEFGASDSDSDDSGDDIDLEASVREEMAEDTLVKRKKFLFKFLEQKHNQLKIQLSLETRTVKDEEKRKVKFSSAMVADEEEVEGAFAAESVDKPNVGRSSSQSVFRPCPLKCDNKYHKYGSVFACPIFRDAGVEEKWEIINRNFLCSSCLQRKAKPHVCKFKKGCKFCKMQHNFLLCRKKSEELAMCVGNVNEESIDDPNLDHEAIFLACSNIKISSADNEAFQVDEESIEEEFVGLAEAMDDDSLASEEDESTLESIMLAVTEKRRQLGIEIDSVGNGMKTIGNIPDDVGRNYILKKIEESLIEDKDDVNKVKRYDTAERKFSNRGDLWKTLIDTDEECAALKEVENEEASMLVEETKRYHDIEFGVEKDELVVTIPYGHRLHGIINKEAYEIYQSLPSHKMDSYIGLSAKLKDDEEMRNYLNAINCPFIAKDGGLLIEIHSLSDSGASLGLGTPEFMKLPLTRLSDGVGYILGSTGTCDDPATKERKLIQLVGVNNQVNMDVRRGHNLGHGKVTPVEVRKSITRQLGVSSYPFRYLEVPQKIDLLISNKTPEAQNVRLNELELNWAKPILSPKLQFFKNDMENALTCTGFCGLENEFQYISNHKARLIDLVYLGTWNGAVKQWFEDYTRNGSHSILRCVAVELVRYYDKLHLMGFGVVREWFTNVIKNLKIFNSFVADLSVQEQSEPINTKQPDVAAVANSGLNGPEDGRDSEGNEAFVVELVEENEAEMVMFVSEISGPDKVDLAMAKFVQSEVSNSEENKVMITYQEQELEKAIMNEDVMMKYVKASCHSPESCVNCKLLNQKDFISEKERYQKMWDKCNAVLQPDGTSKIEVEYVFRGSVGEMFPNSNYMAAVKNARLVSKKAESEGLGGILEEEIDSRVERGILEELSEQEIKRLEVEPHNFCNYSIVKNERSLSTKYRLVSNSSTMNNGKSVSTMELVPKKSLNPLMNVLYSFLLYPVCLTADISKSYEAISTKESSNIVRLMVTVLKRDNYLPRIYKKKTLNFGDKSSSTFLEISILKFVVNKCKLELSKKLLIDYRFSDNPATSFVSEKEFLEVREDITQAFRAYNMQLKYVLGRTYGEEPRDGHATEQPLFGFIWNRSSDEIRNNLKLNIRGFKKGVKMGKNLDEMSDKEIDEETITRAVMLRVSGQLYKNLEWLFGACSFSWKVLTSMALEITTPKELNVDLMQKDPKLVKAIKEMLKELRFVGKIEPFRRSWIDMGERLYGFLAVVDGSKPGYAGKVFCLKWSTVNGVTKLASTLAYSKSKLSKRNVICNETVARVLGNNILKDILVSISSQIKGAEIHLINLGDSISALFSFHCKTKLANTLMVNCSRKFYQTSQELVEGCDGAFQADLGVGYIESSRNSADSISKYVKNPVQVCNSRIYRYGPELSEKEMQDRIVIWYVKGSEPVFDGKKLLRLAHQEENLKKKQVRSNEEGVMVTTRQMERKEKRKSLMEKKIGIFNPKEFIKRVLKCKEQWLSLGYKAGVFVDIKDKVQQSYAKFYTIQALITFHWCVARLKGLQDKGLASRREISAVETFREAVCQMFELSQMVYKPVVDGSEYNPGLRLHIIRPRLSDSAQMRFFNGTFLICLNDQDPLKWKIIRYNHLIDTPMGFQGHRNQKGNTCKHS